MGGAVSAGESNDDLIDNLLEADYIKSPTVERVFRAVDRAHYLTPEFKGNAYKDLAWKSGNLHLSAPCIYSEVMESLKLTAGLSFLNLGSGTGYLSTMVGLILGPYGINHGVEIHEDVVQYANSKLEEFWTKSPALDEYEFCKPVFVEGNCLNLNPGMRRYDRVYCGAACPEDHENYMKNLLNIGGILVMPLNDQLLRCTRTSENTWEDKSVLPVSFASLISERPISKVHVVLPENEMLSLQDACRVSIRCLLRKNIELEHPKLKSHSVRQPKRRVRRRAVRRRLVIPIFEDSDGEGPPLQDAEFGSRGMSPTGLIYSVRRPRPGQITAVIELARSLGRNRVHESLLDNQDTDDTRDSIEEDPTEEINHEESQLPYEPLQEAPSSASTTMSEQRKKVPKREKFDSGLGDEMENGKGFTTDSDDGGFMDIDTESDTSEHNSTVPSGEDGWLQMDNRSESSQNASILTRSTDSPLWKRVTFTEGEESDDPSESDSHANSEVDQNLSNVEQEEKLPEVNKDSYSFLMKSRIESLPLPSSLKQYINLYRDF